MSSGLDKIISQIGQEAKETSEQIIREAEEKAEAMRRETDAKVGEIGADAEKKCAALTEDILKKNRSAAQMQRRRALLAAKQEMIDTVIAEAQTSLSALGDGEYFARILEMLAEHARGEAGQICFNENDLCRLPADFMASAEKIAAEKGGSLTLSKEPRAIDGGFVLVYGGVEENCSFASVFAGARERLQDKLHEMLFAR